MSLHTSIEGAHGSIPQVLRVMTLKRGPGHEEEEAFSSTTLTSTASEGGGDTDHEEWPFSDTSETEQDSRDYRKAGKSAQMGHVSSFSGLDTWEWTRYSRPLLVGISITGQI